MCIRDSYIRGVASSTPALTTSGVAGLAPNVALYLDEQPLSQPGRNLDVYAADLSRVEVLSGPQGTLFGASSQAGTVRLITNKPDPSYSGGKIKVGTAFTKDGDMSTNVEAVFNTPVNDSFTIRGVVYHDDQGGYVDNVRGTQNLRESGRFRTADTVRVNGLAVGSRAGTQATSALSGVSFLDADNSAIVEENFNDVTYSGGRITGSWEMESGWKFTLAHTYQKIEADGVFFSDPSLDDYEIQRYEEDELDETLHNTNWTVEGRICLLYTSPSPRDVEESRMPSSA